MSQKRDNTTAITKNYQDLSRQERKKRKYRLFGRGTPSITQSIANAVVIKNENVFFLTKQDGTIPLRGDHGFGLYYHDCRYLSGYEVKMANAEPNVLVANAAKGFAAVLELTNPEIPVDGSENIQIGEIGAKWERVIDAGEKTLYDVFTFNNYGRKHAKFEMSFTFQADFKDIFDIRGLLNAQPGDRQPPRWLDSSLHFVYNGADDRFRSLTIHFSQKPKNKEGTNGIFNIDLKPGERKELVLSLIIDEASEKAALQTDDYLNLNLQGIEDYFQESSDAWVASHTQVSSDSLVINSLVDRSLSDLRMLRTNFDGEKFFAAGVPWFVTLFGRDSLITAIQMLAYNTKIAKDTLRLLAKYQGKQVNKWRDEQPGKILHEIRFGELARLGKIPHTPYYGSVDATPLFLVLVARLAAWTGDLSLFKELKPNIDLALDWIAKYGDKNQDGYVEYESTSNKGLINQGWKDSGNAIVNADGRLADPPISLVEVQAYVYEAKTSLADLYERAGEKDRAAQLRDEAARLRARFNQEYWSDELDTYVLALEAGGKPVAVVASNPGHALWSGIADEDKARKTVQRLMRSDMNNGWGVRTLSSESKAYNPTGYHLGTVWPHDNSILAAGFHRYGETEAAKKIFTNMVEAAMNFDNYRLPELFTGFSRPEYSVPVRYPVACHPQAWAAGSIPYMLTTLLGLTPEAFDRRLRIVKPVLPDFLDTITLRGLQVADARADLKFHQNAKGESEVEVLSLDGDLEIVVEPAIRK